LFLFFESDSITHSPQLILTAFLIANTSASFDSFAPIVHEKTHLKTPPIPFVFGFPNQRGTIDIPCSRTREYIKDFTLFF
jgi:hypothetical protein